MRVGSSPLKQKAKGLLESSISPPQCRAARGLIGWTQAQLAEGARVSRMTVTDFEKSSRVPHANNLAAIRAALEAAGVIFIDQNGEGPGVRLRKSEPPDLTPPAPPGEPSDA